MEKQEPRNKPPFQDKNKPPQLVWQLGSPSILRAPSHGLHTGSSQSSCCSTWFLGGRSSEEHGPLGQDWQWGVSSEQASGERDIDINESVRVAMPSFP